MRKKSSIIFLSLVLIISAGCTIVRKVYVGPKLPNDQIAIVKSPIYPESMDGKRISKGLFAESWILEALPGTHTIVFHTGTIDTIYGATTTTTITSSHNFSVTVTVKAGHRYRLVYDRDKGNYVIKDVTGKEIF